MNKVEFCGSKAENEQDSAPTQEKPKKSKPQSNTEAPDDFINVDDSDASSIPFFG